MRPVLAFLGTTLSAGLAQGFGVPLDSPAIRAAACGAAAWAFAMLLSVDRRLSRVEGQLTGRKTR